MADEETTIAELRQRVVATIADLKTVGPHDFDNRDAAEVILKLPSGDITLPGLNYVIDFASPNFFFT